MLENLENGTLGTSKREIPPLALTRSEWHMPESLLSSFQLYRCPLFDFK